MVLKFGCVFIVAAALSAQGCSDAESEDGAVGASPTPTSTTIVVPEPETSSSLAPPPSVAMFEEMLCPPGAGCGTTILIEGVRHGLTCGPVRPEALSERVIALGMVRGVATEVRELRDVEPGVMVAIRVDAKSCEDGSRVVSPWSMVWPVTADLGSPEAHQAMCSVAMEEYRQQHCRT